jgi:DNA-binding GntR family transcriptional regulator
VIIGTDMAIGLQTAAEQVYEELRKQIVTGALAPALPLPLIEIANELGVSTTPVRAALSRLQTEGLVVHYRHRGAIVAPLDIDDLEAIQAVRSGIEGRAAMLGAPLLTDQGLAAMRGKLERLRPTAGLSTDAYLTLNWKLHEVCYLAAERPTLLELIHSYQRRAERYIRLVMNDEEGRKAGIEQQTAFVEACEARDGRRAQTVIRDALEYTVSRLEPILADGPEMKKRLAVAPG